MSLLVGSSVSLFKDINYVDLLGTDGEIDNNHNYIVANRPIKIENKLNKMLINVIGKDLMENKQVSVQLARTLSENLKLCLNQLENGEINRIVLINNLQDTSQFLDKAFLNTLSKDEDIFSETDSELPENVQEWISSTFTKRQKVSPPPRQRLRSLINAVRVGMYFDRAFRKVSLPGSIYAPPNAMIYLKQHINNWTFDIFHFNNLANNHSLKIMGYELLHSNQLISRFSIDINVLEAFLDKLEEGYSLHQNPYHNLIHAADVAHTCFLIVSKSRLFNWLSDLELFSILISALVHDFEHTGTSNNYHVNLNSNLALIYNDRSVLENHHLSAAFRLMKDERYNIVQSLNANEYRELRNMVIEMVLATDMSAHFNQVQVMKEGVLLPESLRKINILSYVLHSADISHPCKPWEMHHQWTNMVVEEFFRQGDNEKEFGLTCSPLCDRDSTLIPESQIGFINFIVEPCFLVLGDIQKAISILCPDETLLSDDPSENSTVNGEKHTATPWMDYLGNNKVKWAQLIKTKKEIDTIHEESENDD